MDSLAIPKACASTALSYSAHVSLALAPIYHFGNETQKEKFLPALISGEKIGVWLNRTNGRQRSRKR
jgi:butyryl-CoA dehydrogenase